MTFYYLLKAWIKPWLLPPGLNIALILLGVMLQYYWRWTGRIIFLIGLLSLYLLSTPFVAYHLIGYLQNQYPILPLKELPQRETNTAIVVLGGGDKVEVEYGYKHTVSDFTLHRLIYAAHLLDRTQLPILVSGGKPPAAADTEAQLMASILQEEYKIKDVWLEDKSLTTAEESKYILPILKEKHIQQIYLVTNAWHMPRSIYIFKCAGIKVIPAPMGHYEYGPGYAFISFLPNMDALSVSSIALHEYIGLFWYYFSYEKECEVKG